MYQKCPVCDGQGLVSRPPWIAGDVQSWSDSHTGSYECRACHGTGLLLYREINEKHKETQNTKAIVRNVLL